MRGNELLDKMELMDPAYVEAADAEPLEPEMPVKSEKPELLEKPEKSVKIEKPDKPAKKKNVWRRWGVGAACFAVAAVVVCAGAGLFSKDAPGNISDLPMLTISENVGGMGYEGYMVHDISELVSANPWNEDLELSTLPVYQNPLRLVEGESFAATGGDPDKMEALLMDVAGRLGFDTDKATVENISDGYFSDPAGLMIEAEGVKIEVDQTMTATVSFDPAISLPETYHFTHYASYDDTAAAAEYLKSEYSELIGMDDPQVNIYGGDYNIYGQQMYSIEFFDGGGSETGQMINYNFNRVAFYCDDEGKLFLARVYQPDLSAKVGDYPIITSEQARELLLEGNYLTSVPYEIPGAEYVKKVELIYRNGEFEEYYMPYYRFYVELPEEEREHGLKDYGAYYVPAVDSAYISNMPTWDGSFN